MKRQRTDFIVLCDTNTTPDRELTLKDVDRRDRQRGYFSCVFHFVIKRDGEIQEGHRHHATPAMSFGRHNGVSVSVCLVGGQGDPPFTKPQLASLKDILAELQEEYPEARVTYHHEIDPKVADRGLDLMALSKDTIA